MAHAPPPNTIDRYRALLSRADLLGHGFAVGELVKPADRRHVLPPNEHVARMIPSLRLANELRARMVKDHGIRGLRVNAAYRPKGGAGRSAHKVNAALDLDLLPGDYGKIQAYYETAVRLWCEEGVDLEMGLGLYCRAGGRGGIRVHLDTGGRCRTWQISGRAYIRPALALKICDRLKLTAPTRRDRREDEGGATKSKRKRKAKAKATDQGDGRNKPN